MFQWDGKKGPLRYEVFIGSQEGVADIVKAFSTMDTFMIVSSDLLHSRFGIVIHGITPAGLYVTKKQQIYFD